MYNFQTTKVKRTTRYFYFSDKLYFRFLPWPYMLQALEDILHNQGLQATSSQRGDQHHAVDKKRHTTKSPLNAFCLNQRFSSAGQIYKILL